MNEQLKNEIVKATKDFMEANAMSQNTLASKSKINVSYLSSILKGEFSIIVSDKPTVIAEKWFIQLAEYIQYQIEKTYWETKPTPQFLTIISALKSSKENSKAAMIIGETGSGKTFTVDKFINQHPSHTWRVTVGSHYRLNDIIMELSRLMGINVGTSYGHLRALMFIKEKVRDIKRGGGNPQIILDESENMKIRSLETVKSLYDYVNGYGSIVLIGTRQLLEKIEKGSISNKDGMPQLKSRFKVGLVILPSIDTNFNEFLKDKVSDPSLIKLLRRICDNYRELHDYLEPALREADRLGVPLTEDLFRKIYNLPKK